MRERELLGMAETDWGGLRRKPGRGPNCCALLGKRLLRRQGCEAIKYD